MKKEKVGVIGLGYIGIPLTAALANVGYRVVGVDVDKQRIKMLKQGIMPLYEPGTLETVLKNCGRITFTTNYALLKDCSGIFITVGTPLGTDGPNMEYLFGAVDNVLLHLRKGAVLILKSTVKIGTTREVAKHIESKYGKKVDKDYYLAFCPERTIEGLALHELYTLPKIVGGMTKRSSVECRTIVGKLGGRVTMVSKPEVAELCKLVDNSYRALNIAFANELGDLCENLGIDSHEVVSTVNNAYDRTHIFKPGLGAGGPCLIKDPEILQYSIGSEGIIQQMINCNKTRERSIAKIIEKHFRFKKELRIAYVGIAFKGFPETDDVRSSPSIELMRILKEKFKVKELLYDPLVNAPNIRRTLDDDVYSADCVIFLTDHPLFKGTELDMNRFKKGSLVLDCWNILQNKKGKTNTYTIGKGYAK